MENSKESVRSGVPDDEPPLVVAAAQARSVAALLHAMAAGDWRTDSAMLSALAELADAVALRVSEVAQDDEALRRAAVAELEILC